MLVPVRLWTITHPCTAIRIRGQIRGLRRVPGGFDVLLHIPGKEWQVEGQRQPIPVNQEQEGQETVHGGLRDDVSVEPVAEVDRVDVVTASD